MYNPELYKGTLKLMVLKLLKVHGKLYGYEITKLVKELSKDRVALTEGALYPTLHKLEEAGLITAESFYTGKRVRKYYTLSPEGKKMTKKSLQDFSEFMETMHWILFT